MCMLTYVKLKPFPIEIMGTVDLLVCVMWLLHFVVIAHVEMLSTNRTLIVLAVYLTVKGTKYDISL